MASSVKSTLFIFILYRLSSAQDNSTTCDIPWVEPLANTSITCHFPINVNQTSTIFGVSFESNDREKKIQDILDCGWFSGKMKCSTNRPGYKYNDIIHVSNTFSLEIPQASIEHNGRYTCHLVNIRHENFKPCEFKVKVVGKTMCLISSMESKTRTSLTCYYPEDLNKTRMNFTVYHYSRTGLAEVITACEWKGDNLTCNTTHGYEFDGRVSDYLTLKIPMALESQEGAYSCHISDTGFLHYENCTLEKMTSTCHISSVEEAKPTALTCKFSVDVNMTKRSFTVVRLNDTDREAAVIASCTWLRDHLTCTTAVGYQFNNTVTDHVIISLPQASHNHSGTYACHLTGTVSSGFEPCELIIMPVSDKSFLSGFITAANVIVVCIPLSLMIVFFVLRKTTSHMNKRLHKEAKVVNELTPMIPDEDCERDQKDCVILIDQDMVRIQEKTVDTRQKASQDHSPIQSNGHEEDMNQTSSQNGTRDRDTQPPSNGDITGNNKTQVVLDGHSPIQSDEHEEEMNQTSPQSRICDKDTQPPTIGNITGNDKTQDVLGGHSPIQSDGHEKAMNQTSSQSRICDKDTQPPTIGDITGSDKTQDVLGGHSPIQSDGHEEEMNQTSPQSSICDKDTQPPSNGHITGNDKTQDVLGGHSPIQSDGHEKAMNQTSSQSRICDKDTQPPTIGDITGNDKTRDVLDGHLPIQSDGHEEDMNQTFPQSSIYDMDTQPPSNEDHKSPLESGPRRDRMSVMSPQKEKGSRKRDVATDDNQATLRGMAEIRVVLVGKTGAGKSSLGNTLLGRDVFRVETGLSSGTEKCKQADVCLDWATLNVTDTPGLYDPYLSPYEVLREINKMMALTCPGPHIVVLVLRCDRRFTKEEYDAAKKLLALFGDDVRRHLLIVFTGGDCLEVFKYRVSTDDLHQALQEEINKNPQQLKEILSAAYNRYCVVDNTGSFEVRKQHAQVVFRMMQELSRNNNGSYYTNQKIDQYSIKMQAAIDYRARNHRLSKEQAAKISRKVEWKKRKDP